MSKIVSVFDPQGVEHKMEYANARDMVTNMKWKWELTETPENLEAPEVIETPASVNQIVTVYDLDGEPHTMDYASARDMTAHCGWSFTKKAAKLDAEDVQPEAETPEQPESDTSEENQEQDGAVDFEAMTKDEIVTWAKNTHDLTLDGRLSKASMIAKIAEATAAA